MEQVRPTFAMAIAPRDVMALPHSDNAVRWRFSVSASAIRATPASVMLLQRSESDESGLRKVSARRSTTGRKGCQESKGRLT
jgi:hypothetical protein